MCQMEKTLWQHSSTNCNCYIVQHFFYQMSNDNELITNSILKTICCKKLLIFPFHGITSSYSYFEVIWIFVPIQQEAKHDQEKLSAEQKWKVHWQSSAMFCLFTDQILFIVVAVRIFLKSKFNCAENIRLFTSMYWNNKCFENKKW